MIRSMIGKQQYLNKLDDIMKFQNVQLAKNRPKFMLPNIENRVFF